MSAAEVRTTETDYQNLEILLANYVNALKEKRFDEEARERILKSTKKALGYIYATEVINSKGRSKEVTKVSRETSRCLCGDSQTCSQPCEKRSENKLVEDKTNKREGKRKHPEPCGDSTTEPGPSS
eukprot:g78943.t1